MKIPFLHAYIRSHATATIRNGMRGYRRLNETGKLAFIFQLKEEITNTPLTGKRREMSFTFLGAGAAEAELVLRQFLVSRVLSYNFNKKVLAAIGKGTNRISHPLPPEWRMVAEKNGLVADTLLNQIIWGFYLFLYWLYGYKIILQSIYKGVKELFKNTNPENVTGYVYFDSLSAGNLPKAGQGKSYNIFNWYNQWPGRERTVDMYCHNIKSAETVFIDTIKVMHVPSAIPVLASFKKILLFVGWNIRASIQVIGGFFRSDYRYAILFGEASIAAKLRLADSNRIARDYLFHNANWIYRPLWTYDAEKKGSRILFYFYSTNIEGFKRTDTQLICANSWQLVNWPNYLVWDRWQADFINRVSKQQANIEVVGSIWFSAGNSPVISPDEKIVAVFDINPLRDARYYAFAEPIEYLVPEVINRFLIDIYSIVKEHDLTMVLKRKRDIGNLLNSRYKAVLEMLSSSPHFRMIDMETSAIQLIAGASMVISLPFTSTALISRELGKPACYYDPTGLVLKDDPAAHGITIISGREELRKWIYGVS